MKEKTNIYVLEKTFGNKAINFQSETFSTPLCYQLLRNEWI